MSAPSRRTHYWRSWRLGWHDVLRTKCTSSPRHPPYQATWQCCLDCWSSCSRRPCGPWLVCHARINSGRHATWWSCRRCWPPSGDQRTGRKPCAHCTGHNEHTHTHAVVKERRALIQRPIASDGESPNKRVVHVVRQRMHVGINQDTGHVANQLAIVARNLVMANNGCCFSEW